MGLAGPLVARSTTSYVQCARSAFELGLVGVRRLSIVVGHAYVHARRSCGLRSAARDCGRHVLSKALPSVLEVKATLRLTSVDYRSHIGSYNITRGQRAAC